MWSHLGKKALQTLSTQCETAHFSSWWVFLFCHFGNLEVQPSEGESPIKASCAWMFCHFKTSRCYARYCCSLILTDFLSLNRQMQHIWISFPGWIPYGCTVSGKGLHWLTLFHLSRVSQRALELLSMPSTPLSWQMVWSTGAKGWCWTPWESGCLEPGQPSSTRLSSTARFSKLFLYLFVLVRSHLCWSETKATELLTETQIELVWVIIVQCLCFISLLWCCSLFIIVFVGNPQSYTHN